MKLLASLVVLALPSIVVADPTDSKMKVPVAPPVPAKPMPLKPAAELAELGAAIAGTWKCVGKGSSNGKDSFDMKATISSRMDLDQWWIQTNFTATMGKETYKFTGFTGYNNAEKKFYRHMVDNFGSSETDTATSIDHGMAGKWAINWTGEQRASVAMPGAAPDAKQTTLLTKHSESMSKDGLAITGEVSMDAGKTWVKAYDATCAAPKK